MIFMHALRMDLALFLRLFDFKVHLHRHLECVLFCNLCSNWSLINLRLVRMRRRRRKEEFYGLWSVFDVWAFFASLIIHSSLFIVKKNVRIEHAVLIMIRDTSLDWKPSFGWMIKALYFEIRLEFGIPHEKKPLYNHLSTVKAVSHLRR